MTLSMSFPIDAVIPWVDGSDPHHAAKLSAYLATLGMSRPKAASPTRFHNAGELDYCVTSLLKFAPWIRTIFIVTDEQRPALMEEIAGTAYEGRIKLVDHREIFTGFEEFLPTFNSSSILSVLWRIPGLAENFLFLNDDFALIQPVTPEDFFREGKVVLRGRWHFLEELLPHKRLQRLASRFLTRHAPETERVGFRKGQQVSARLLGFNRKYFRLPHNPHAWRVSTQRQYFTDHPEVLKHNVSYKLRSPKQLIGEALAAHLEIKNNNAIVDNRRFNVQLKPAEQSLLRIRYKLAIADRNPNIVFTCVQSIETASQKKQELIFKWLDKRIGSLRELCQSAVPQESLTSRYTGEADTTGRSSDLPR